MKNLCLLFTLLYLVGVNGAARADEWQATLTLKTVSGAPLATSYTLVPKQSVQMTATVWMPEDINWFPQFPEWDMPQATIVPMFMLSPSIERDRDGTQQRGATQNYLITPLAEGELKLAQDNLRVYPDRAESPQLALSPVTLHVAMPEDGGDIQKFLPATQLKLTQSFYLLDGETSRAVRTADMSSLTLKAGQMIERRILIQADGIQGKLIPAPVPNHDVVENREESTDLTNYDEFIGGMLTSHWFYAARNSGKMTLPALTIRWFNTDRHEFMMASLPATDLRSVTPEPSASPELGPTLSERLQMLTAKQIISVAATFIAFGIVIVLGKKIAQLAWQFLRYLRRIFAENSRVRLIRLLLLILVYGPGNRKTIFAFNALNAAPAPCIYGDNEITKQWSAALYGKPTIFLPSRFSIILQVITVVFNPLKRFQLNIFKQVPLPDINQRQSQSK